LTSAFVLVKGSRSANVADARIAEERRRRDSVGMVCRRYRTSTPSETHC
jgi:hypothetical protein